MNKEKRIEAMRIIFECHKELLPYAFKEYIEYPNGGTFLNLHGIMSILFDANNKIYTDDFSDYDYDLLVFAKETLLAYKAKD